MQEITNQRRRIAYHAGKSGCTASAHPGARFVCCPSQTAKKSTTGEIPMRVTKIAMVDAINDTPAMNTSSELPIVNQSPVSCLTVS